MLRRSVLRTLASLSTAFIALSAALISARPALAQGNTQIEGTRWVSVDRTKGGVGVSYVFLQGGVVVESVGAMLGFTYRQSGNTLTMNVDGQDISYKVMIGEQNMTMLSEEGNVRGYVRSGPRTSKPELQGLWAFRHETGAPADILFGDSGQGLMRVLMKERRGTFSSRPDGGLVIELPGTESRSARLDGDVLELRGEQRTMRLKRG